MTNELIYETQQTHASTHPSLYQVPTLAPLVPPLLPSGAKVSMLEGEGESTHLEPARTQPSGPLFQQFGIRPRTQQGSDGH